MSPSRYRYAYLHGFASSPLSRKAQWLADTFAQYGLELECPDLNCPSFEKLTYSSVLETLDALDAQLREADQKWRWIGSSMGGYLAALWASQNPDRVDELVLLCPGMDLVSRWPSIVGADAMRRWQEKGALPMADAYGTLRALHWGFIEDAQTYPAYPELKRRALIIHGRADDVVPIDFSRKYQRAYPDCVQLVEVEADHSLLDSLDVIANKALKLWGILQDDT